MVVFACNNCGESLKKNQVEKHVLVSRRCTSFSCMDCCQDFSLTSYKLHTSCVSEAQRYQGALYDGPGEGETKGARKQKEWIEQVKQSIESASNLSPRVSSLLKTVSEYPNVPRKQKKFENFVRNSLKERNSKTIQEVWEAFSGQSKDKEPVVEQEPTEVPSPDEIVPPDLDSDSERNKDDEDIKTKKRKKKKKRDEIEIEELIQPEGDLNAEIIDSQDEAIVGGKEFEVKPKHKKKKRKHREIEKDSELDYPEANFIENEDNSSDINSKKLRLEVTEKKHKKKKKYKIVEIDI